MGNAKKAGISFFLFLASTIAALSGWYFSGTDANAAPRPVTPRGELHADEKATIELFEKSKASVVFISTREKVVDLWTRNVFSVPRGTGSGFI